MPILPANSWTSTVIIAFSSIALIALPGCDDSPPKKSKTPITKRTTQDVRDPKKEQAKGATAQPAGPTAAANVGSVPGSVYVAGISTAAAASVKSGLDAYFAENGDYPKTHDDFMENVIKKYQLSLPALPHYQKYAYDVEKRQLMVLTYPRDQNQNQNQNQNPAPTPAPAPAQNQPAPTQQPGLPTSLQNLRGS